MAARFWVGGTGTWDASDTTHWAASSGGAGGQSVPGSSDDVTFDANSGGGTVTVDFGGTISIGTLTMGAFTGTLDFATNNNSITLSAGNGFNGSGTGTRTLNMGGGTWSLSANQSIWNLSTVTNLTFNANGSTIAFTSLSVSTQQRFQGGGRTYNVVTFAGQATGSISITGANTFNTLTIGAPNRVSFPSNATTNITNFTNISTASSAPVLIETDAPLFPAAVISSANNWTCNFCGFQGMTFQGGGVFTANNSFNFGDNSGITINPPAGGGVVGVIGG